VVQYRLGDFEKALATLSRSDELNQGQRPAAVAFIAMASHRLGRAEATQAALVRLRTLMKDPSWADSEDAKAIAQEAETLISRASTSKPGDK
jgi:hypothetical protein